MSVTEIVVIVVVVIAAFLWFKDRALLKKIGADVEALVAKVESKL